MMAKKSLASVLVLVALALACERATPPRSDRDASLATPEGRGPEPSVAPEELEHAYITADVRRAARIYRRGLRLFAYDRSASLDMRVRAVTVGQGFREIGLTYASPRGGRVPATLHVPRGPGPFPALILQHGMPGTRHQTSFLARRFALSGVVTLAIDAPFARRQNGLSMPVTLTRQDRREQIQLIVDLRRGIDLLARRRDVAPSRIGYHGVSYGAAMGGLLAGVEKRISSFVLAVGDGGLVQHETSHGFAGVTADRRRSWIRAMEPIEPIYYVAHAAPSRLLFLNALRDEAVSTADAVRYQRAGSEPKDIRWYDSDHSLPVEADCDAALWLNASLHFVGETVFQGCPGDHEDRIAFASDPDGFFWAGAQPGESAAGDETGDIYTVLPDGSDRRRLTDAPGNDFTPRWSPDGSKIVFRSTRDGNDEIYVMDSDGSNQTNLSRTPYEERSADWSPDGSQIIFASSRNEGFELYVMDADGSDQQRLTNLDEGGGEYPDWSPDGERIAFHATAGLHEYWDIFVMRADGSDVRNITATDNSDETYPQWSPDGRWVLFEAGGDVHIMRPNGSARRRLTKGKAVDANPVWSPDGRSIVFTRHPNVRGDRLFGRLFVMTSRGTHVRPISARGWGDIQPSWRP